MQTKFKVGDSVRYIEENSNDLKKGEIYKVRDIHANDGVYLEGFPSNSDWWYFSRFELAKTSSIKLKPVKFALQYELDKDPTEYFATLPEVKARLKELSGNSSLKRDKIFLHTLSKTQKVELGTSITIRKS